MKQARVVLINLLILLFALIGIELIFGGWLSPSRHLNHLGIIRDRTITTSSKFLYEPEIKIDYVKDKYGLRGKNILNQPESIDILTVGGSTTEQRFITEGQTWQDNLEERLHASGKEYYIANAGVDGQSTIGHIKNFELWFPQIPNLRPKYIFFYVGVNDLVTSQDRSVYDDLDKTDDYDALTLLKKNSALFSILRNINGIYRARQSRVYHKKVDFKLLSYTEKGIANEQLYAQFEQNLHWFEKRLNRLIKEAVKMGATPVFISQPTYTFRYSNQKLEGNSEICYYNDLPYNGVDYYHLLIRLNKRIQKVCLEQKLTYVDLTSSADWDSSDFYDFIHQTPRGTRKVAAKIFEQLPEDF